MIKINLIPTKRKKKSKPAPLYIAAALVLVMVTGVVAFLSVQYLNDKIKKLKETKKSNEQKSADLDKKIKEVKDYEELNKKFTARKQVIEDLTKGQALPARVLDEISQKLTDGIWLISIDMRKGGLNITGVGYNNSDIVTYVESMKHSSMFSDVTLQSTTKTTIDGYDAYNFTLIMKVKT